MTTASTTRSRAHRAAPRNIEQRRERIADAALDLLAANGARGLTHRAVDRALGLADGSTSFYYRTRAALLLAAAERLVALDLEDLDGVSRDKRGTAALIELWTGKTRRTRSLARMELLLYAARDPAFRFMHDTRNELIGRVARADSKAAEKESRTTGVAMVALVDGLTLHGLLAGRLTRTEAGRVLERLRSAAREA